MQYCIGNALANNEYYFISYFSGEPSLGIDRFEVDLAVPEPFQP